MGELSRTERVLGTLRNTPLLYRALRSAYRIAMGIPREVLRVLSPVRSRVGPPKGWFSAFDRLRRGELEGKILFEGQEVPPADATSMRVVSGIKQEGYQPWPAFWTRHRDVRLVGASLVAIDERKLACIEAMHGPMRGFERNPAWRYFCLPKPVSLQGPWTSLVSFLGIHFYHWLYDELPRLAVLPDLPSDTRILIPESSAPYISETIQMLGLEERVRPTSEHHLIVEDFYFSAPSAMLGCPNPHALDFLRSRLLPHADHGFKRGKRIYLVRSNKTRGIVNAAEVDAFFESRGWDVVDPERLSLAQQMSLFSSAEMIVGLHGGAFVNLAWCSPGCKVLEFFASNFLNGCYEGIAVCLGLQYRYLIFPGDKQHRATVDLAQLRRALDEG